MTPEEFTELAEAALAVEARCDVARYQPDGSPEFDDEDSRAYVRWMSAAKPRIILALLTKLKEVRVELAAARHRESAAPVVRLEAGDKAIELPVDSDAAREILANWDTAAESGDARPVEQWKLDSLVSAVKAAVVKGRVAEGRAADAQASAAEVDKPMNLADGTAAMGRGALAWQRAYRGPVAEIWRALDLAVFDAERRIVAGEAEGSVYKIAPEDCPHLLRPRVPGAQCPDCGSPFREGSSWVLDQSSPRARVGDAIAEKARQYQLARSEQVFAPDGGQDWTEDEWGAISAWPGLHWTYQPGEFAKEGGPMELRGVASAGGIHLSVHLWPTLGASYSPDDEDAGAEVSVAFDQLEGRWKIATTPKTHRSMTSAGVWLASHSGGLLAAIASAIGASLVVSTPPKT